MKIFEIMDEENGRSVGTLLYYETARDFMIELQDDLDEWTGPLLFSVFLKQQIYTVPRKESLMWVKERVIPAERQNINTILKNHGLREYDEMKLLELSHGRCSQDSLCIKKLEIIPAYVSERAKRNIRECVVSPAGYLICFFEDDTVRKVNVNDLADTDGVDKVIRNKELYLSGKVSTGGYAVTFNNTIDVPAWILHEKGERIPLTLEDFKCFVRDNVTDTSRACDMLECTRQNISYMVGRGQLSPIQESIKGNLYLKGELLKNMW